MTGLIDIPESDGETGIALYHAGDQGDYMFTVRSGTFKLVQYLPDGGQRIVRIQIPCH